MTERLFGQTAAEQRLARTFATGRMHHAWLLTGPEGIGKATLAWRAVRHALARPEDRRVDTLEIARESPAARQVAALSHPSLLLIRRPWDFTGKRHPTVIPVDEVRRLRDFLAHSADAGTWRVIIVDRADEMNPSAANALLKSLEEPPTRALFLLISSMPGRLLPTIRSRCRTLSLDPLGPEDLAAAVRQAQAAAEKPPIPEPDIARLTPLAQGSVRRLLGLLAVGGHEIHGTLMGVLSTLPKLDRVRAHALADSLLGHGAEAKYQAFLELWSDTLAGLVRARATETEGDLARLAARIVAPDRVARWAEAWERTQTLRAETEALNLDKKALILELFALAEAAAAR
jgi:DNA polymerase-3 subunit delta'